MSSIVIGIDLGTTTCKCTLFDEQYRLLAEDYVEYELHHKKNGFVEQDANTWWRLTQQVIKRCVLHANVDRSAIRAMAISSQGLAITPVDQHAQALAPAISWLDTRAVQQRDWLISRFGASTVYHMTGKRINEAYTLPKLMWLREHEPQLFRKTHCFLLPHDFIVAKLCGKFVTDRTLASGTMAYDLVQKQWSDELLDACGVQTKNLPTVTVAGTPIGTLNQSVASDLGLSQDVVVCVGGQDQKCAALAASIDKDTCTVSLGTASAILKIVEQPISDPNMRIPLFNDLLEDNRYMAEGVIGTACAALKWLKNTFFRTFSYAELDQMVEQAKAGPSPVFFFPFLSGAHSPYWYTQAKASFYGITLSTTPYDMVKSVLEGVAYQIASNLSIMDEYGDRTKRIVVFGGGATSDVWCRLIADVTGKTVIRNPFVQMACLGAATLAGAGIGFAAPPKTRSEGDLFLPNPDHVAVYRESMEQYTTMQHKMLR